MTTSGQDRLFVPLTAQAFEWWGGGRKRFELRRDAPRWSDRHVYVGRRVELRRGYSGSSLWGRVTAVLRGTWDEIQRMGAWAVVIFPDGIAHDDDFASLLGEGRLVAFEVELDPGQGVGK